MNPEDPAEQNTSQLHHQVFLKIKDSGTSSAADVAEFYGISVDDAKALCRQAIQEILQKRGHLLPYEETVNQWAET